MTKHSKTEPVARESASIPEDQLSCLLACFPEAFTEGKVDMEKLRDTLGDIVEASPERYSFTWAGKKDAIRILQTPSRATLIPSEEESVKFDTAQNLFIEGDNLEVLKLLYKGYFGQVKMVYIDPPYNTGNDFIYPDNYADPLDSYLKLSGQKDAEGNLLTSNPNTNGRFHSAWLSMMYPRLFLARQLLREDGVIFVSIDDNEVNNLRSIMNEIFGEENFIAQIAVQLNPRGRHLDRFVARTHEYVMVFARDANCHPVYALEKDERMLKEYNKEDADGKYRELELRNRNPAFNSRTRPNLYYPIYVEPASGAVALSRSERFSVEVYPRNSSGGDSCWTWGTSKFERHNKLLVGRKTSEGSWRIFRKDHLIRADGEKATTLPKALWLDKEIANDQGKKSVQELFDGETVFDFPKAPALIQKMIQMGTDENDIVLDFFAGSAVTAHAVLEENSSRRFILVQLPEPLAEDAKARKFGCKTIADIATERIRRAIKKIKSKEGFKVFKLGESNYRPWTGVQERDPEALAKQMEAFNDPLVEGWKPKNVLYEVAIKEGFGLNIQNEHIESVKGLELHRVTDPDRGQSFYLCLDDKLNIDALAPLKLTQDDLFICRDIALDDTAAANLALQCRLKTI